MLADACSAARAWGRRNWRRQRDAWGPLRGGGLHRHARPRPTVGGQGEGGGGRGGATDAQDRNEQERRGQSTGDRSGGVGGIEIPGGPADGSRGWPNCAHEGRKGAAHQQSRHTDRHEQQCPRERAGRGLESDKSRGRVGQSQRGGETQQTRARFECREQPQRSHRTIRPATEQTAADREPRKKALTAVVTVYTSTPTIRASCFTQSV